MNTPNRPDKEPNDHDIAALFDEQTVSVPDELDATILASAKQAVSETLPAPESKPAIKLLSKTTNRWFALAATVVVGISVAPVLLKSPESSLDAPTTAPIELIAESAPLIVSDDNGGAAGDLLLQANDSAPVVKNSALITASNQTMRKKAESEAYSDEEAIRITQSHKKTNASPAASTALFTDAERALLKSATKNYRNTTISWINEIMQLESKGKLKEAAAEYALFREKYPDVKPHFKLRSQMEKSATDDKPASDRP